MASLHRVMWVQGMTIWTLAATYLASSGYTDVPTFVNAIRQSNAPIIDWQNVPVNTVIILPYMH